MSTLISPFSQAFEQDNVNVNLTKDRTCCEGVNRAIANLERQIGSIFGNLVNNIIINPVSGEIIPIVPPPLIYQFIVDTVRTAKTHAFEALNKLLCSCDPCCIEAAQAITNATVAALAQGLASISSVSIGNQGFSLTPEVIISLAKPFVVQALADLDTDIQRILNTLNKKC